MKVNSQIVKQAIIGTAIVASAALITVGLLHKVKNPDLSKLEQNTVATTAKNDLNDTFKLDFKSGNTKDSKLPHLNPSSKGATRDHRHLNVAPTTTEQTSTKVPAPTSVTCDNPIKGPVTSKLDSLISTWLKNFTPANINKVIGNDIGQVYKDQLAKAKNKKDVVQVIVNFLEKDSSVNKIGAVVKGLPDLKAALINNDEEAILKVLPNLAAPLILLHKNTVNFILPVLQASDDKNNPSWDQIRDTLAKSNFGLGMDYKKLDCNDKNHPKQAQSTTVKHTTRPAANTPKIIPTTVTCDKPIPEKIQNKIDHWQENFKRSNIDAKIGNELSDSLKSEIEKVKNKKDLLTIVFKFLETDPNVKDLSAVKTALPDLKKAFNDANEEELVQKLPSIAAPLMAHYSKTVMFIVATTQMNAQDKSNPAWDEIKTSAEKDYQFILGMGYVKIANCTSKQLPKEWQDKINHWRENFKRSNIDAKIGNELSDSLKSEIEKVKNKKDLLAIVINFLETDPNVKDISAVKTALPDLKKAFDNNDESAIALKLPAVAGPLMAHYSKTVMFIVSTIQANSPEPSNPAWDEIRDAASLKSVGIDINYAG